MVHLKREKYQKYLLQFTLQLDGTILLLPERNVVSEEEPILI